MNEQCLESRIFKIDFIKITALFLVISLHYIQFISGWLINIDSPIKIAAIAGFLVSECCVPLFIMCSGFLLAEREFSWKGHYKKLDKILLMYIVVSCICGGYRGLRGEEVGDILLGVLTFSTAPYSWYIKYYIFLFRVSQ